MLLGSAPERLIKVEWDESVGEIYSNLDYENDNGNQYDLYIPSGLDKLENPVFDSVHSWWQFQFRFQRRRRELV